MICALAAAVLSTALKPNVVIFLVDDLGWQDTSLSMGLPEKVIGRHLRTPNLEKLAKTGLQLTQAYSSCPVCTPTRTALLTGVNPARSRITSWVQRGQNTDSPDPGFALPKWKSEGLQPKDYVTLAEVFRDAGYRTVQIGKAHFGAGGTAGAEPKNLGFDRCIAGSAAGHPSSYFGLDNFAARKKNPTDPPAHNDVPDLQAYHGKDIYLEEALAIEGSKQIEEAARDAKPLFLWYSPYAVHTPLMPNRKFLSKYKSLDPKEAAYATMVESFDEAIGALVSALKKARMLENTYIIFTSDNGGLSQTARGGPPNLHDLPLRSGKGSAYEGGVRVPFVITGPGIVKGKVRSEPWLTSADLFSTISELAGLQVNPQDGQSFALDFKSEKVTARSSSAIWHYPHFRGGGGPGLEPFSAIRWGNEKAIFFYETQKWEFYNLQADIGETVDLTAKAPAKLAELQKQLRARLTEYDAQYIVNTSSGKPIMP